MAVFAAAVILFVIFVLMLCVRQYMKNSIAICTSRESMKGKVIIVTGANTGIGYYTAKNLAERGGRVILACRDEKRGTTARDSIIAETGNLKVVYQNLNMSSLDSVRQFVKKINETEERLDVLINNAGVHGLGNSVTKDGLVEGMQINFFAPFLLTLLLLPKLKQSKGRIINVSSILHYFGFVNLNKLNEVGAYNGSFTYCNSKLCVLLFTKELARRLVGSGVTVNAVHPGVISTNIVSGRAPWYTRLFFAWWCWICCRTAEEGAQTVIYLAVADECSGTSGEFFVDCKPHSVMFKALNVVLANNLWTYAENLVGYRYDVETSA